jgi:hypothetical protein
VSEPNLEARHVEPEKSCQLLVRALAVRELKKVVIEGRVRRCEHKPVAAPQGPRACLSRQVAMYQSGDKSPHSKMTTHVQLHPFSPCQG